jgi:hypothetical protein
MLRKKKRPSSSRRRQSHDEQAASDVTNFDAGDLINKALRHDLDASVLEAFDDSWMPRAKNVYDWCTNRKFLGIDPFPMQMYLMLELFEDYCPDCSDMVWWRDGGLKVDSPLAEIKDRLSLLRHGKCKKCGKTRVDFVKVSKFAYRDELAACLGQRAGKTACVGFIATYQLHRFLTLRSPWQTFGVLANQKMLMTFVALTEKQVMESLWDSFIGKLGSSPWFDQYHKFLREEGKRLGEELFSWKTTFVTYFHKKLMAHYAVADERTLRGPTRFFASVDEVGWFDAKNYNKKVKGNARGVIASLSNSLATVRGAADKRRFRGDYDLPTAIMCNIGSPSSMDDEIMHLVRRAAKYNKIFAMHAPTWEINPEMSVEACRRAADEEGGVDFDRDFGAIPPLASDPFIPDKNKLDQIFCRADPPVVRLDPQEKTLTLYGHPEIFIWYKVFGTLPERTIPRMVAVDTGETFNSFCVTIAHYDNVEHHIIIDQVIEINPAHGRRVFFPGVRDDLLLWLADNLRVRLFAFDRWQSSDFVHTLANKKQDVVVHSLTYAEMVSVRASILSDQVQFPETEFKLLSLRGERVEESIQKNPVSHLKLQLATIRNLGRRVVKPAKGTDDLWRTVALAVHHINALKQDFATYVAGSNVGKARGNKAIFAVRKGTFGGTGGFPGSSASYFSKKAHGPRGLVTVKKGTGMSSTTGGRQPGRPPVFGAGARKQ